MDTEKKEQTPSEEETDKLTKEFEELFKEEIQENSGENEHQKFKEKNKLRYLIAILVYFVIFLGLGMLVQLAILSIKGTKYKPTTEEAVAEAMVTNNDLLLIATPELATKIQSYYPKYLVCYPSDTEGKRSIVANVENLTVKEILDEVTTPEGEKTYVVDDHYLYFILQGIDEDNWLETSKQKIVTDPDRTYKYTPLDLDQDKFQNQMVAPNIVEQVKPIPAALSNLIIYAIAVTAVGIVLRQALVLDYKRFASNRKKNWGNVASTFGFVIVANVIVYLIQLLLKIILKSDGSVATNQFAIEQTLSGGAIPIMALAIIIGAPIVEELVFRKSLFSLIKNKWIALVISSLLFGLLHTVGDLRFSFGAFIYNLIPYTAMGVAFGLVYIRSKENVFVTILAHGIYNTLSLILLFLL